MAIDTTEQVNTMYKEAQKALQQDLRQSLYDAAQNRNQAFRLLNNQANANHSLYSGAPAGMQMQYDQQTFLPGVATMAQQAINRQVSNQQSWDEYMEYIKQLNEQAADLESKTNNLNGSGTTSNENTTTSGGMSKNPNAQEDFADGQG